MLEDKKKILDFGSGPVGNIKLLADNLINKNFYLLDYSVKVIEFAQNNYLGDRDSRGNTFYYFNHIDAVSEQNFDAILALEVLEHIIDHQELLDHLWNLLEKNGILIISVPVKGLRDRHREHLNYFTIRSMFDILCKYSEWIHISLRTHSKRSGILTYALF